MKTLSEKQKQRVKGKTVKKELNIYKIATEAGVSPATVSRVLTNNARVSEEKRKKVEEVIRKYDYRPNALARGLTNTKTKLIGIMTSDLINPFYSQMVTQCVKAINKSSYDPVVFDAMGQHDLEVKYLHKLFDLRVDAILLMGGKSDQLVTDPEYADLINRIAENIPVITTGKVDGGLCYEISIDELGGVTQAMEHLLEQGHRKIALIGGKSDIRSTFDKRMRYRSMLRTYGIAYEDAYVMESSYDIESGYQCMKKLLEETEGETRPTAVMAINDFSAIGVLRCIKEKGLRIPEDIALLSFDDTYIAETLYPRLTSVSYDYEQLGEKLVEAAIHLMNSEPVPRVQQVPTRLMVRESTGKSIQA